eukprot:EG_transcript_32541
MLGAMVEAAAQGLPILLDGVLLGRRMQRCSHWCGSRFGGMEGFQHHSTARVAESVQGSSPNARKPKTESGPTHTPESAVKLDRHQVGQSGSLLPAGRGSLPAHSGT